MKEVKDVKNDIRIIIRYLDKVYGSQPDESVCGIYQMLRYWLTLIHNDNVIVLMKCTALAETIITEKERREGNTPEEVEAFTKSVKIIIEKEIEKHGIN